MAVDSLVRAWFWFIGHGKKEKPLFQSEKEAYDFCRRIYNETGGATDDLRRAFEYYQKNYDDSCEPQTRPKEYRDLPL